MENNVIAALSEIHNFNQSVETLSLSQVFWMTNEELTTQFS